MRNARLAESMLSLVTAPARAISTVGDLIEESPSHRPLWFWAAVSWTALSLLSRDLASNPWRVARLAAFGLLIELLLIGVLAPVVGLVAGAAFMAGVPQHLPGWVFFLLGWSMAFLAQFEVGRLLARRAPGQELASCVAMTLLTAAAGVTVDLFMGTPLISAQVALELTVYQMLSIVPLLAGAIVVRRQDVA
jgi:hypothetical protein